MVDDGYNSKIKENHKKHDHKYNKSVVYWGVYLFVFHTYSTSVTLEMTGYVVVSPNESFTCSFNTVNGGKLIS